MLDDNYNYSKQEPSVGIEGFDNQDKSPLESGAADSPNKVLGSERIGRFLGSSVRQGSWLNWGLVLLIGFALFAIYKIMSVILFFVG